MQSRDIVLKTLVKSLFGGPCYFHKPKLGRRFTLLFYVMKNLVLVILIWAIPLGSFAQEQERMHIPSKIYKDRITDQDGRPLSGIRVKVKGKIGSTYTNANGEFSIKAEQGDVIELSKNGEVINTYRLDGSIYYQVEDEAEVLADEEAKSAKKISSFNKRSGSQEFNHYIQLANENKNAKPLESIDYIRDALEIATANNNKTQLAQSYYTLGDIYMALGQYDLAVKNYRISLENSTDNRVQIKLAKAYTMDGKVTDAIALYKKLQNDKNLSKEQQAMVNEGLGDVYMDSNRFSEAIEHFSKALSTVRDLNNPNRENAIKNKLAKAYEASGDLDKAESYILPDKAADQKIDAVQSQRAAEFYSRNRNIDKEVQLRRQTVEELEQNEAVLGNTREALAQPVISRPKAKLELGKALLKQNNYKEALPILEESAEEAKISDDIATQKDAVQQLSEVYAGLGADDKALKNYREYVGLVDKLYQQKEEEIDKIVALNRELAEKQNRISSLEKDRELTESQYKLYQTENQLTIENDRRQKLIIYSLLGGLVLLITALYFMYRSNKQRRLANNVLALRSLRTQMNPHFIFNALNSVNNFIAKNDERAANRYLSEFSTLMRSVLDNSEEDFITLEKELELLRLYLKLEHARFTEKFDYELNIDDSIDQEQFLIPPMLLQPYVENAVWHGLRYKKDKGFLKVNLRYLDSGTIKIEIMDNGIGRTQSKALKTGHQKKKKSKGMQNIKQRIEILNNMYKDKISVDIKDMNNDKTGTIVTLILKKIGTQP